MKNDAVDEVARRCTRCTPWQMLLHFRIDRVLLGSTLRIDLQVARAHVGPTGLLIERALKRLSTILLKLWSRLFQASWSGQCRVQEK